MSLSHLFAIRVGVSKQFLLLLGDRLILPAQVQIRVDESGELRRYIFNPME